MRSVKIRGDLGMSNDSLEVIDIATQTPGQIIKATREARRISISEVVQRLLLSKQVILALEDDNYSKIPAQVYAEGYLKAYAQFLQIPSDTIIKSFRRLNVYPSFETKKAASNSLVECKFDLKGLLEKQKARIILSGLAGVLVLSIVTFFAVKLFAGKDAEMASTLNAATTSNVSIDAPEVTVTEQPSTSDFTTTNSPESSTGIEETAGVGSVGKGAIIDEPGAVVPTTKTKAKAKAKLQ